MDVPDVSDARSGDVAIAYQAIGEGPRDLVLVPFLANLYSLWRRVGSKLAGLAVNVGARVSAAAGPGEVLVSGAVKDLVAGSGLTFDDRGERELKGLLGSWRLYALRE